MQKRYLVRIVLGVLLIAGSFMILASSSKSAKRQNCSESIEECCKKKEGNTPSGDMIWETLSRQFISSVEISH